MGGLPGFSQPPMPSMHGDYMVQAYGGIPPPLSMQPMHPAMTPKRKPKAKKKPKKKPKAKKKPKKKPEKKPKKKPKAKKNPKGVDKKIGKSSRKKKIRDPDAPKRSRTAFNYFLDDFRGQFKMENPDSKGVVPVTRAGSIKWKVSFERMRALSVLVRIRAIQ